MLHKNRIISHPGEILAEEFLKPLGLSANALALALRVPAPTEEIETSMPSAMPTSTVARAVMPASSCSKRQR